MKHVICPVLDTGTFTISCNNGRPRNVAPGYEGVLSPCAVWDANTGHCGLAAPSLAPAAPAPRAIMLPAPAAPARQGFWKRLFRL